MLVLQILIVPIVLFLMLGAVFIVGSIGMELPGQVTREHRPTEKIDDGEASQNETISLPIIPILKI